jgi:heptosyltransferase-2
MSAALERPLAVRLPNWVGDVCMALPALQALGAHGRCRLFGKPWAVDLLSAMGWDVVRLPEGVRAAAALVRASSAREGVLLTNSFGSALRWRLAGVAATGYRAHARSWLLGRAVASSTAAHEVERFWQLAQAHLQPGVSPPPPPPRLGLVLHAAHRTQAASALAGVALEGPYVVLCPLATGLAHGHSKIWPAFPLLCRGLIEQGVQVVSCPGPGEEAASAAALPGAIPLPGLGLGAYAEILRGARYVISNDSGPLHLAAAVDVPVLGIFGVSDPHRTSPWGARGATVGSATSWPSLQDVILALKRMGD